MRSTMVLSKAIAKPCATLFLRGLLFTGNASAWVKGTITSLVLRTCVQFSPFSVLLHPNSNTCANTSVLSNA